MCCYFVVMCYYVTYFSILCVFAFVSVSLLLFLLFIYMTALLDVVKNSIVEKMCFRIKVEEEEDHSISSIHSDTTLAEDNNSILIFETTNDFDSSNKFQLGLSDVLKIKFLLVMCTRWICCGWMLFWIIYLTEK